MHTRSQPRRTFAVLAIVIATSGTAGPADARPPAAIDATLPAIPGWTDPSDGSLATNEHDPSIDPPTIGHGERYSPTSAVLAAGTTPSLTPSQHDLVAWAKQRFVVAGLEPPSPDVVFASDRDVCHGHHGLFQGKHHRVSICINDGAASQFSRKLMLHELAHAWAREHLSADDRHTFVELRGAASWNDRDDPWAERGTEHAAEILAWGLMDIHADPSHIQPTDNASLRQAFLALARVSPINDGSHPATDPTAPPARPDVGALRT
jgi:hypothetical protein